VNPLERPPRNKSAGYAAYQLARAAVSSIPVAGGPLSVLFETLFTTTLRRRSDAWLERLAHIIDKLSQDIEGITAERLADHEKFMSCALEASLVALHTHQKEKLDALASAVYNSALPNSPDDDLALIFIRMVNDFTPWHIRVLRCLHDCLHNSSENILELLSSEFPDLRKHREFLTLILNDLRTSALIHGRKHTFFSGSDTTDLGKEFLEFVTEQQRPLK
jgi:hypothetical protein